MSIDPHDAVSAVAVLSGAASLIVSLRKKRGLSLTEIAVRAVAYAEQLGGSAPEKLAHAIHAAQRLDAGDNGKRDFSDAQLRITIEAELSLKK